ncbi:hypothetical protein DFH09DRAFT_1319847 [Mycena vulgaris]|nr:hypothetical protein DFH09DRAFT_1319847 [Mycena vulgaris]
MAWRAGDGDKHIGTYEEAAAVLLDRVGSNGDLGAIEYAPATPTSFIYQRHAYNMRVSFEVLYSGAILGENISPLIRICRPDRHPWPERFTESEDIRRPLVGPPFQFWDLDWNQIEGELEPNQLRPHAVVLSPDLPGQLADELEPARTPVEREPDSSKGIGWQGAWAVALLEKQARKESLGGITEIIWSSEQNPTWAVEVRLDVVRVVECEDYDDEMSEDEDDDEDTPALLIRGISDYEVHASVLRVFVKSEKIAQL